MDIRFGKWGRLERSAIRFSPSWPCHARYASWRRMTLGLNAHVESACGSISRSCITIKVVSDRLDLSSDNSRPTGCT